MGRFIVGVFLSMCLGAVMLGALILLCFIVGELQRRGRKQAAIKRAKLEESLAVAKARDEMRKRTLRLKKEKVARARMQDEELEEFDELTKKVANELE